MKPTLFLLLLFFTACKEKPVKPLTKLEYWEHQRDLYYDSFIHETVVTDWMGEKLPNYGVPYMRAKDSVYFYKTGKIVNSFDSLFHHKQTPE